MRPRLTIKNVFLFCECWIELARAAVLIRVCPASINARNTQPGTQTADRPSLPVETKRARSILNWVDRAANHHLKHMACLERAVAGQRVMMRRGWSPRIEFGVRKEGKSWEAHAWLSENEEVLYGGNATFDIMRPPSAPPESPCDVQ